MELREFISETISNVIFGIEDAREKIKGTDGKINPPVMADGEISKSEDPQGREIEEIEFEISLKLEEKEGSKATIGVFSGIFGGSVEGKSASTNQAVNKIKFSIPIVFPRHKENSV